MRYAFEFNSDVLSMLNISLWIDLFLIIQMKVINLYIYSHQVLYIRCHTFLFSIIYSYMDQNKREKYKNHTLSLLRLLIQIKTFSILFSLTFCFKRHSIKVVFWKAVVERNCLFRYIFVFFSFGSDLDLTFLWGQIRIRILLEIGSGPSRFRNTIV